MMSRKNYSALSQTLCATGVVILYAVTFACYALYHFDVFGPMPTFLLMALITISAFSLAVRLNALVVAILGMLGGFLTPILLSTGQDNPLGLFGYIAILDAGLIVSRCIGAGISSRRWPRSERRSCKSAGQINFSWPEIISRAIKILIALGVLLGFTALFLAGALWAKSRKQLNRWLAGALLGLAAVALLFTAWFFTFPPLAQRPWLMFSFVFLVDLAVVALAWMDNEAANAQPVVGLAVFGLLTEWTMASLNNGTVERRARVLFYLRRVPFHFSRAAATPPVREPAALGQSNFSPRCRSRWCCCQFFSSPTFRLSSGRLCCSWTCWPSVWPWRHCHCWPVLIVLMLTLAALGELIFKIPTDLTGLPESFFLLGAFSIIFVGTGVWLAQRFKSDRLNRRSCRAAPT